MDYAPHSIGACALLVDADGASHVFREVVDTTVDFSATCLSGLRKASERLRRRRQRGR